MLKSIVILDFGSQFTQLIARRVRELEVYAVVVNPESSYEKIMSYNPSGFILSGGPSSVTEAGLNLDLFQKIFASNIPILGICYGLQLMCTLFGGSVESSTVREYGVTQIEVTNDSRLFNNAWQVGNKYDVLMSHSDAVSNIPKDFIVTARSKNVECVACQHQDRDIYALQFHPEVTHTLDGKKLLSNFLFDIVAIEANWNMSDYIDTQVHSIQQLVGKNKVICALSGGVDSTVTAVLLHRAIKDNLTCVFVNTGLLRYQEEEEVRKMFADDLSLNVIYEDASELFLDRLKNITDSEEKRKIIGKTFIEVFDRISTQMEEVSFLAQGTLYPDVIESSHPKGGGSATIKSHHNVGGLPKDMKMKLVEPLRDLFKDEVRKLGAKLSIADNFLMRHPFPGPGLAIRIIGDVTESKLKSLKKADHIFLDEIRKAGLYNEIWQAFAVLMPVKTVGVMGDARTYEDSVALRAVTSVDGMTASCYHFEMSFLEKVANRIVNEVEGINRVVYDVTGKPPGTIEWE